MSDEKNNILNKFIWTGPKIAKYGSKHLGIYDLQISIKHKNYQLIRNTFDEITKILRYNEFRKMLCKDEIECYQFIKPISNEEIKSYSNNSNLLLMSVLDILNYANERLNQQMTNILNQNQVKNRSSRETRWKEWYNNRIKEENDIENRKIGYIETYVMNQELKYGDKLLAFQINHVKMLYACLNTNGVALDASDTGTGKTYSALCLAQELGLIPVIVCPKSIIPGWVKAIKFFGLSEYYVNNYEQYRVSNTPYLEKVGSNQEYIDYEMNLMNGNVSKNKLTNKYENERMNKKHNDILAKIPRIKFQWKLDAKKHILIFDECHKTKNSSTLNYAIYWWAKKEHDNTNLKILSLSATVSDKINNAYSICYMLGLVENGHDFNMKYNIDMDKGILKDFGYEVSSNGFYKFNQEYEVIKEKYANEDTNLRRLHNNLFPINGSRMVIKDLGDSFPENFVQAQTYDMDKRADEIQNIYRDMEKNLLKIKYQQIQQKNNEIAFLENKINNQLITPIVSSASNTTTNDDLDDLEISFKPKKIKDNEISFTFKKSKKSIDKQNKQEDKQNKQEDKVDKPMDEVELIPDDMRKLNELRKNQQRDMDQFSKLQKKLEEYGTTIKPEHLNKTSYDKDESDNTLTIMLRARQKVELLKADTIIELATEFYEQQKSIVIFINFIETMEYLHTQLRNILKTERISILKGGQNIKTREEQLDLFQSDHHRIIIATMGTGREGINLHDLNGKYPRVSLISPSWSAQDLIQALGRICRAETKSKCLQYLIYCAGTIEDRICELVQNKIKTINTINDGDLTSGLLIDSIMMES